MLYTALCFSFTPPLLIPPIMPPACVSPSFLLLSFHSPSVSPCSLTEHGGKYKASIFIGVSERHPVSLLLGNTGECSPSFRLADHSCTGGSRLLWLPPYSSNQPDQWLSSQHAESRKENLSQTWLRLIGFSKLLRCLLGWPIFLLMLWHVVLTVNMSCFCLCLGQGYCSYCRCIFSFSRPILWLQYRR